MIISSQQQSRVVVAAATGELYFIIICSVQCTCDASLMTADGAGMRLCEMSYFVGTVA